MDMKKLIEKMDSFSAKKKFLTEGADSPITVNGKAVDTSSLEVDGIDTSDYPDFADAYFAVGYFADGSEMSVEELDSLRDQEPDLLYDKINDVLYENKEPVGEASEEDWYDDDEDDEDDEYDSDLEFAKPGSGSALRAATKGNPRIYSCPTCERPNMLTRKDINLGYQCDYCADKAERGFDESKKSSLKDYFNQLDEALSTQMPIPVVGKQGEKTSAQVGFLNVDDTSPAGKALSQALGNLAKDKKAQIVVPTTQQQKTTAAGTTSIGATGTIKEEDLEEVITKKTPAGKIIKDFQKSTDPKFKGKSKEERKKMALGAYYGMHPEKSKKEESKQLDELDAETLKSYKDKNWKSTADAYNKGDDKKVSNRLKGMMRASRSLATGEPKQVDEKWAGDAEVKSTGQYSGKTLEELKSMLAKIKKSGPHELGSPANKRMKQIMFAIRAKKGWKGGVKEAEIPSAAGVDTRGAGLGAGRNPDVLESGDNTVKKTKVREAADHMQAAYHEGRGHGLSKHGYSCRFDEGSEEHKQYHKGYCEGLDECYGMKPIIGEADIVPDMAEAGMGMEDDLEEALMSAGFEEGNAFTGKLASTPKGGSFALGGKTYKDTSTLDEFAFESLDKQLNALLTEDAEPVAEGLSVSVSTGQPGQQSDSVSVNATDDDAGKLLQFIKQVGLGGLGGTEAAADSEAVHAPASDYGAPAHQPDDHDGMLAMMKKMTGDYADEEGQADDVAIEVHGEEEGCAKCGESSCECGEESVEEVESYDQEEEEVAENSDESEEEDTVASEESEAKRDSSMPDFGGATNEAAEEEEEEQEQLDEWANEAGKKGTDEAFQTEIEYMTRLISGGLNKEKVTGQTTIPVIAGQKERMGADGLSEGSDSLAQWKRLSGITK